MSPDQLNHAWLTAIGLGAGLLLSVFVLVAVAGRRLQRAKRSLAEPDDDHDRVRAHVEARLTAQREQARAETLTGAERVACLQRAIALYRQANQLRGPHDDATFETIKQAIGLLEEHLREEGVDPAA